MQFKTPNWQGEVLAKQSSMLRDCIGLSGQFSGQYEVMTSYTSERGIGCGSRSPGLGEQSQKKDPIHSEKKKNKNKFYF